MSYLKEPMAAHAYTFSPGYMVRAGDRARIWSWVRFKVRVGLTVRLGLGLGLGLGLEVAHPLCAQHNASIGREADSV